MDPLDPPGDRRQRSAAAVERRPDDALEGRGVVVFEVVLGDQRARRRRREGRWRQRQDLEPSAVEGDEVHVDEAVAHDEILIERQLERGAE
jgi:hypothetical protein